MTTNIQTFPGDVEVTSNLAVNTDDLFVDTVSGRVGIGVTSPRANLHLVGVGNDSGPRLRFETLNNGNSDYTVSGKEIGGIQFGADDLTWTTQHMSSEIVGIHYDPNYSGAHGTLAFKTSSTQGSSPTEKMRISYDGNVGIGTASPKQKFEVDSSGYGLFSGRLGVGNMLTSAQNGGGQNLWDIGSSAKLLVRVANNANPAVSYANARAYAGIALVPGFDGSDTTNMGLWGGGSGENPTFYIQNQVNLGNNGGGNIALQPVAGYVGIGTTSPGAKLHIQGDSVAVTSDPSVSNYGQIEISSSSYAGWSNADRPTNLKIGIDHTIGGLGSAFIQGVVDYINASVPLLLCPIGGNVGIGTTSPDQKLHLYTSDTTNNIIKIEAPSTQVAELQLYHTGDSAAWSMYMPGSSDSLRWYRNGDRMSLTSDGNVGIGTVSPGARLDVAGTIRSTVLNTLGDNEAVHVFQNTTSPAVARILTTGGSVYFQTGTTETSDSRADLNFTSMYNGTNFMTIKAADGNVGIGTASPQDLFHIYGASDSTLRVETDTGQAGILLRAGATARRACRVDFSRADTGTQYAWIIGDYEQNATDDLTLGTSGGGRIMTLTQGGNVGIGTASPGAPLEITSTRNADSWANVNSIFNVLHNNGGGGYYGMSFAVSATHGDGIIQTHSATNGIAQYDLRLQPSGGNVGIGTTNPAIILDVGSSLSNPQIGRDYATGSVHDADKRDAIYFGRWDGTNRDFLGMKCRVDTHTNLGYGDYSNQSKIEFYTWGNNYAASREVMCIRGDGHVGIGTVSPASRLHHKQTSDQSYSSATLSDYAKGTIFERAATTDRWTFAMDDANSMCFFFNTARKGYLLSGGTDSNVNFTGQHRTFIKDVPFTEAVELEGLIVSADQNKYIKMSGGIEAGSNAITTNESLPVVSISNTSNDKKCFGVISASEDPEKRQEVHGNFVSDKYKELGDTRVYINSVGEGAIWVTNVNGPLESGDYITTSNIAGYGMKQDSEFLANYTVAKITMDCDFNPATQPVQIINRELANVNYWVETTYSNVALDEYSNLAEENRRTVTTTQYSNDEGVISFGEYSNLESNAQATYSEIETVTYQKIEREESKTEREGWTLEIREELVNVLDEHGQLQWEDHPTDTEKVYKIRYLTSDGTQTDEANAAHIAAFVGCTYHCG